MSIYTKMSSTQESRWWADGVTDHDVWRPRGCEFESKDSLKRAGSGVRLPESAPGFASPTALAESLPISSPICSHGKNPNANLCAQPESHAGITWAKDLAVFAGVIVVVTMKTTETTLTWR